MTRATTSSTSSTAVADQPYWLALSPVTGPRSFSITTRDGTIATVDGGTTWGRFAKVQPFGTVWDVAAAGDAGTLYGIQQWVDDGSGAALVRSGNGGRTWQYVTYAGRVYHAGDYADLGFSDARNGWIVTAEPAGNGEADIRRTYDGGRTWNTVLRGGYPEFAGAGLPGNAHARFVGASLGFAVGVVSKIPDGPVYAGLVRSLDGGRSWRPVLAVRMYQDIDARCGFDVECAMTLPYFSTPGTAYAATVTTLPGIGHRWHVAIVRSTDAGFSWTVRSRVDVTAASPPRVVFVDYQHWVVVNGSIATDDGGRNWHAEVTPDTNALPVAMAGRVYVIDDQHDLWVRNANGRWVEVPPGSVP